MKDKPNCKCGENDWFNKPDNLTFTCKKCSKVILEYGGKWVDVVSIQDWLKRTYDKEK